MAVLVFDEAFVVLHSQQYSLLLFHKKPRWRTSSTLKTQRCINIITETGLVQLTRARKGFYPCPDKQTHSVLFLASDVGQCMTFSWFLKLTKPRF